MELMLKNWKNVHQRIRIARPIPALDGIDAKEIYRVPTKPKRGLKATGPKDRVDMKLYECTFPQVSLTEGVRILIEKQPKEPGKEGLKVTGEKIPARELQDLDIQRLIGSGVFHTIQNDRECIATNQSGFISVDPKDERISVTEAAVGHDVIGPKTGSVEILSVDCFIQQTSVQKDYTLICNAVTVMSGSIEGTIISRK